MTLYLVRHSKAHSSHPRGDSYRMLSSEGERRAEILADQAALLGMAPDLVLSSPYARAVATAKIFCERAQAPEPRLSTAFLPESDWGEAMHEIESCIQVGFKCIAVFTHNPFVGGFATYLCQGAARARLEFSAPTAVCLAFDQGFYPHTGRFLWTVDGEG